MLSICANEDANNRLTAGKLSRDYLRFSQLRSRRSSAV